MESDIQNSVQLKTYELFISGAFHCLLLDEGTETSKSKIMNKGVCATT